MAAVSPVIEPITAAPKATEPVKKTRRPRGSAPPRKVAPLFILYQPPPSDPGFVLEPIVVTRSADAIIERMSANPTSKLVRLENVR